MICLDFDGVLFDTAKEAYIVASKAYFGVSIEHSALDQCQYSKFLLLRPFVISPWQYLLVFDLISENLDTKALLKKYRSKSVFKPTTRDRDFEYKFNSIRGSMIFKNKSEWLELHEPYAFFQLIKPMLVKCPQFFRIVSTKNKKFILELLFNQDIPWKDDQVWGSDEFEECGRSKAKMLNHHCKNSASILFIDDSYKHLSEVGCLNNVEVISANWGYTEMKDPEDNTKFVVARVSDYLRGLCQYY